MDGAAEAKEEMAEAHAIHKEMEKKDKEVLERKKREEVPTACLCLLIVTPTPAPVPAPQLSR